MKAQNFLVVCVAVALGFLIGERFIHQTTVRAQPKLQVYVQENFPNVMEMGPTTIDGTQVVGFSCILDKEGIFTKCYTEYTK